MKLHQVLALLKGASSDAHSVLTRAHHDMMKSQLLVGRRKTYQPANDEDTTQFPEEYQKVQNRADRIISGMLSSQVRNFDLTAARDFSNMRASADVEVDGQVLIKDAPVPYLLWLDKKFAELEVFIRKLPVLDPAANWSEHDEGWVSQPVVTTKTKKVKKVLTLHPATDKHPAQVAAIDEDVVQGYWTSVQYSGALPQSTVNAMLRRVRKLQDAVKSAIAEANSVDVIEPRHGKKIFDYLFTEVVE